MEKKRISVWQKLGIDSDLGKLLHFPFRYEDETRIFTLDKAACQNVPVSVDLQVLGTQMRYGHRPQLLVSAQDSLAQKVQIRFFNLYPSQIAAFKKNAPFRVFGEVRQGLFGFEMMHPRFSMGKNAQQPKSTLTPIYPTTAGLAQTTLQNSIALTLKNSFDLPILEEVLPVSFLNQHHLPCFKDAVCFLHAPPSGQHLPTLENKTHPAWQRIKLDELLAQQISLQRAMNERKKEPSCVFQKKSATKEKLLNNLPFELTRAQKKVVVEIENDLTQTFPMHRLLQGDVGSGKTIVAACAVCQCVDSGYSAALMAPTEILAEQHAQKFKEWLEPLGVCIVFLTGAQNAKTRKEQYAKLDNEKVLIIGTHALIQHSVLIQRLGLVIVDEQHRFGVGQRLALREKGRFAHQLMMSATPIPRTLAMSYYADLDVSTIDELPQGRTPIQTRLIKMARRNAVIDFVQKQAEEGRQIYWVCPLVEESEKLELQAAIATEEELKNKLPHLNIALLHGRLKSSEKEEVMKAFSDNHVQILVATTVIEVGVDVPNASIMVIDHAERFGLTQLHQLRGRVGRGAIQSQCVLLYSEPLSDLAKARLKVIFENTDGFAIANEDLKIRGPGELVGQKQSGMVIFRYANLNEDLSILEWAKTLTPDLLNHPQQAELILSRWHSNKEAFLKA